MSQVSAGGSLANTLVALARLGSPATASPRPLRVAMTGCVGGNDVLGSYVRAQLKQAGVHVVGATPKASQTGTVMVFSTPDAQRSFLSCFSSEDDLTIDDEMRAAVSRAKVLLIEGYLWELPGSRQALPQLIRLAKQAGTLVALTAGDAGVVARHRHSVWEAIAAGVDILFTNAAEASALIQSPQEEPTSKQQHPLLLQPLHSSVISDDDAGSSIAGDDTTCSPSSPSCSISRRSSIDSDDTSLVGLQLDQLTPSSTSSTNVAYTPEECAKKLASSCSMVVVTDGSKGSYITAMGDLFVIPPCWSSSPPVDTCGAGDAYAAGLLYALLQGSGLSAMGQVAARTASAAISRYGPQLTEQDAQVVAKSAVRQQDSVQTVAASVAQVS